MFSSHDFFDDTFFTTVEWCTADAVFFIGFICSLCQRSQCILYAKGLPEGATEARYLEKIRVIGVDPFILFSGGNGTDITRASLPPVDSSDRKGLGRREVWL